MENLVRSLMKNNIKRGKIENKLNELYNTLTFSKSSRTRKGIQKHINKLERDVKVCDMKKDYFQKNNITTTF